MTPQLIAALLDFLHAFKNNPGYLSRDLMEAVDTLEKILNESETTSTESHCEHCYNKGKEEGRKREQEEQNL